MHITINTLFFTDGDELFLATFHLSTRNDPMFTNFVLFLLRPRID